MPLSSEPAAAFMFSDAVFASPASLPGPLFFAKNWKPAAKNDDTCVQVMRDGSPPRSKKSCTEGGDPSYSEWMFHHPSALTSFDQLVEAARDKKLALFLDYDGTLSPIVENPDRAFMSAEMRDAVKEVARHYPTSIITGRSREKVFEFVQLPELFYAGSHGMDIMGPANPNARVQVQGTITEDEDHREERSVFQPASEFLTTMADVLKDLQSAMSFISGSRVEDNKFCISVHYRQVSEDSWKLLADEVQRVLSQYPDLTLTHGRKVLEIRPSIKWDKGKAVEFLLSALDLGDNVVPIYIGDDRTDEDAFNMLNDKFNGFGILVSNVPKSTSAAYSLRDTSEVQNFLKKLAEIDL